MHFSVINTETMITSGRWEYYPTYTLPNKNDNEN